MNKLTISVLALLGLSACGVTRESYIEDKKSHGYSMTRGRVVLVEGLSSNKIEPLADGTALTITLGKARLTLKFENELTQAFDLGPGVVVVLGSESDCILQAQAGLGMQ